MNSGSTCLSADEVMDFVSGRLLLEAEARVEEHLDGCDLCRETVAETVRAEFSSPTDGADTTLTGPGDLVGRYCLEKPLGVGASAVVWRAYDPQLERRIALKVILAIGDEAANNDLREARAMARLSHPNVITVFDAGFQDGRVFIAMEIVEGETLAFWQARTKPNWRKSHSVLIAAGEGLAACHQAGVTHRDFKPDNILVGNDGRVLIADFGLARSPRTVEGTTEESTELATTAAAGTPLFMSPEQFNGQAGNAKSDQFAFAVALYTALYEQHPFGGCEKIFSQTKLAEAVRTGAVAVPPSSSKVPKRMFELVRKGLSRDPAARFDDMASFVRALRAATSSRWPKRTAAAIALASPLLLLLYFKGHATCGNGKVEAPESCDDGNSDNLDGCTNECAFARCGDGLVRAATEECDDGNTSNGDACTNACLDCKGAGQSGWAMNDHCYGWHETALPWQQARETCWANGGDLVSVTTTHENQFVTRNVRQSPAEAWLGLSRQSSNNFEWASGEPVLTESWAFGQPDKTVDDVCVVSTLQQAAPPRGAYLAWRTSNCNEAFSFICERTGWRVFPGTGNAFLWVTEPSSWQQASYHCSALHAQLATLNLPAELAFVGANTHAVSWIGGRRTAQGAELKWQSGEPFLFHRFGPGQPDNETKSSNCLALSVDATGYDRDCSYRYGFICEIGSGRTAR